MDAFHTIWTEPARMKDVYGMPDYEILVMIISALNWRKYNGNITLYADDYALEYLEELKLLNLWNDLSHCFHQVQYHQPKPVELHQTTRCIRYQSGSVLGSRENISTFSSEYPCRNVRHRSHCME